MTNTSAAILSIALELAPDGKVQEALVLIRRDMQAAGEDDRTITLSLAGAIVDGLRHGNWPGRSPVVSVIDRYPNDPIRAIKELRTLTGMSLREALDATRQERARRDA
jgi:ribosomal protein L7/L12